MHADFTIDAANNNTLRVQQINEDRQPTSQFTPLTEKMDCQGVTRLCRQR
jgi:hypothetical protein